jgi:signal transduction histidine kinase
VNGDTELRNLATLKPLDGSQMSLFQRFVAFLDSAVPREFLGDPEQVRRARLISRFGVLGGPFGMGYAVFYIAIGHKWGALIILICSPCFAAAPYLMRWKKSVEFAGHFLVLILTLGFTALCCVEGGMSGHAMAWLVCIPLCALLLLGQASALRWAAAIFFIAAVIAALDLMGIRLPVTYNPKWGAAVSAAGYLGLIIFMFILGLIFEAGRTQAFARMREALAELAKSNERLVYLNNEKNEFLGIAAHDLKNPLTVILGSADLAGQIKDPDKVAKLLANISGAAGRMRDLITNLLDVNAIEEGKFTSRLEPCDVRVLVERSVENNQPIAAKKTISIRLGVSEGLWARADAAATLQILDNLISNAVKFSAPNTTVYVHTLPEATCILISVRDEGPGISEADQKKLFNKFTRASARPTAGESSTGLGLAIVKRLAEAMGGTVQCHSVLGAGATFTLRLPICLRPTSAIERQPVEDKPIRKAIAASTVEFPGRN